MYLLTLDKGWVRTIIVSQLIGKASVMRGLILSQYNVSGNNFAPVCAPIVYIKDHAVAQDISCNEIVPSHPSYPKFASLLNEAVSQDFLSFSKQGVDGRDKPGHDSEEVVQCARARNP
jgi:hypothetical protein